MAYCTPQPSRRHNPVDSICRKLQTIQWRGDREPNSPFQIPKISAGSVGSPQCAARRDLEDILKKSAVHRDKEEKRGGEEGGGGRGGGGGGGGGVGMPSSSASKRSAAGPLVPPSNPYTSTPANITYTITSTLGERKGADGGGSSNSRQAKVWQRHCSTPTGQAKESPYFTFTQGPRPVQPSANETSCGSPAMSRTFTPSHGTLSYNLNFSSADPGDGADGDLPYPALVVKRLSMGDGVSSDIKKESMAEISLLCEENLLDTIFYACDTQRRGKVFVSHIVDYLRHTTSRSSEDSGLEELCNMLDPEHKDVSIDLDTYHAVMKEWIDDCRREESAADENTQDAVKLRDSLCAKRSMLLNMTSGSLEAFGGEASRAEFETSELVYCVADLQMSNQKLQEEVRKLKQVVEGMEDSNQKLAEENEELRNQARVNQQLAQKEKILKEEVEEMKVTLSCTEEGRARASAHSKHVERENQNLISKIASLQEENFKATMEMDELQRRITGLCDLNGDLQVQIHSFDAVFSEKEGLIQEKNRQISDMKAAVEEYSSLTELLRADKSKLENQMQMMHPDLAGGLSLSVAFRLNQSIPGSLQTELALAQSPLEVPHAADHFSTSLSVASPLDETLDREVLLMLQGPAPEHMAQEFRSLVSKLKRDFAGETKAVLSTVECLMDDLTQMGGASVNSLQAVQAELDARRSDWALSLDQLAQYTDSLEKELIKMASNMRRSRTEILHLSVRVQEQENQKRKLCDELEQLKTPQDSREASCQTPVPEEEPGEELDWDEEFALQDFLKSELEERNCREQRGGQTDGKPREVVDKSAGRLGEEKEEEDGGGGGEERWMVVDTAGEAEGEAEVRGTSTPLSALLEAAQPGHGEARGSQDSAVSPESEPEGNCQALQEEAAAAPVDAHSQAVSARHPETDVLPDLSRGNVEGDSASADGSQHQSDREPVLTLGGSPPAVAEEATPPDSIGADGAVSQSESNRLISEDHKGEESPASEADSSPGAMSRSKSLSQEQLVERSAAEDSTCLLPVLMEEEESSVQDSPAEISTASVGTEATEQLSASTAAPPPAPPSPTTADQSASSTGGVTSDPGSDTAGGNGSPNLSGRKKRVLEQSLNMEVIDEQKSQEDQSEGSPAAESEAETSRISDNNDTLKDCNSLSPNDKEVEAEFQRLALGFKCDMFTLEKRLRLEERSRDLAEENVRREVSSCQGLLQALTPLCEDDNQSMEIIQRLQKNLDILIQSMTRVSSRSEMLGAIHQENRIGKAVEVMIQHVENLRRMYTKEHAELLELRETLMQNERSFGSHTERDDFRAKKQQTSQYYKQSSARRVSIAAIPRSGGGGGGGNMHFDMSKTQDCSEAEAERLTRRSPWNVAGKSSARPPLKRFVSSAAWVDTEEPSVAMKGGDGAERPLESDEQPENPPQAERRKSSLSELGSKLTSLILPLKTPSSPSCPSDQGLAQSLSHGLTSSRAAAAAVARGSRGLWLWLAIVVVLAGLLALLASLVMQPAVDAAPVGTGDSWMTIQQLLWPYAGLRHNGQPPV
ncbi:inositol 1,4,5-triphosphate receptor associated 2 isoform X3 [Nelusetta ayraudi]|uniref:inositol 1,4,5-triphosphate receptor associated 2 isoform X3 n=1 Tax=Nelusetta ayraudi TaxID=303726 RepID=UPI003F710C01